MLITRQHGDSSPRYNRSPNEPVPPYRGRYLAEVAWVIARAKGTYLHAQCHRIARRRGKYRAVVAVRHSVLVIIYHMLRDGRPYTDLGPDYFERLEQHHVKRLNALGYGVTLAPFPPAEPVPP